jgi:hypothetical protein
MRGFIQVRYRQVCTKQKRFSARPAGANRTGAGLSNPLDFEAETEPIFRSVTVLSCQSFDID